MGGAGGERMGAGPTPRARAHNVAPPSESGAAGVGASGPTMSVSRVRWGWRRTAADGRSSLRHWQEPGRPGPDAHVGAARSCHRVWPRCLVASAAATSAAMRRFLCGDSVESALIAAARAWRRPPAKQRSDWQATRRREPSHASYTKACPCAHRHNVHTWRKESSDVHLRSLPVSCEQGSFHRPCVLCGWVLYFPSFSSSATHRGALTSKGACLDRAGGLQPVEGGRGLRRCEGSSVASVTQDGLFHLPCSSLADTGHGVWRTGGLHGGAGHSPFPPSPMVGVERWRAAGLRAWPGGTAGTPARAAVCRPSPYKSVSMAMG